ncbi:MAG: Gfo/Idh/MocA family oxidoreductase [Phycisphaerales bacterium]|nr:MAG: Gfo/Idh/MocA family oxidoreductase [Phycisphaerales bacterium]
MYQASDRSNSSGQTGDRVSRRKFISRAAASAGFTIVPRHVLGGSGYTAPSEKLGIAAIGVGGQGAGLIKKFSEENEVVALCDVDQTRAAETFSRHPQARKYEDFREMLETQRDIDAVVVATPDHTHAAASIMAIKMGKHVYCEKPLTRTVYEARQVAQAAREAKVATQMGNQYQAGEGSRLLCEWIWDAAIGPVHEVHVWTSFAPLWEKNADYFFQACGERPKETPAVPSTLNWNLWLGPAPYRPYHPAYLPFVWRGWRDFGTGALGDFGCHFLTNAFRALRLGHPTSVEATCTGAGGVREAWASRELARVNSETYPLASIVRYEFGSRGDMPSVRLTWYDGGLLPPRPDELERGRPMGVNNALFIGEKGKIMSGRLIPDSKMKEYRQPPKSLPRSIGHYKEWIGACKGGKPAGSNFEFAGLMTEVILLGNIAICTGEKLNWDGPNMRITNSEKANEYIHCEYRDGWIL